MKKRFSAYNLCVASLFVGVISVCSWVSFATVIPVTMQLFAILLSSYFLSTTYSVISVAVYLLLGAVGVPIFSLFRGGISHLLGPTGGFLIGFIPAVFVSSLLLKKLNKTFFGCVLSFFVGTVCCYIFGVIWFSLISGNKISFFSIYNSFLNCVLPFIPFDLLKILLAALVVKRFKGMGLRFIE